jgi:hypothetical protein
MFKRHSQKPGLPLSGRRLDLVEAGAGRPEWLGRWTFRSICDREKLLQGGDALGPPAEIGSAACEAGEPCRGRCAPAQALQCRKRKSERLTSLRHGPRAIAPLRIAGQSVEVIRILHGVEIPPYGGDTVFTNLIEAYRGLSPAVQQFLDGLQAVHRTSAYDLGSPKPRKDGRSTGPFVSLHPLIRVHPETGEKLVFFNPGTVSHIAGLKERESRALLDLLFHEVSRPEYQVRFQWRPKSLVVWDNQAVAHAGPIDYAHFDLPRAVRRITVAGDLPVGPDGFRSRPIEGELFNVLG